MMNRLHPDYLKVLQSYFPNGNEFTEIVTNPDGSSTILGNAGNLKIERTALGDYLKIQEISVKYDPSWTVSQLYHHISKRYALYWVEGVDYEADSNLVSDVGLETINHSMPETSLLWKGSVLIRVYPQEDRPKDPVKIPLDNFRVQQALVGHVITGKGRLFTDQGVLSANAAKALHARLVEVGIESISLDKLKKATRSKSPFGDCFTSIAAIAVENYGNLFFRFDYEKDNATPLYPK